MFMSGIKQKRPVIAAIALVMGIGYYGLAFSAWSFADYHRYGRYDDFTAWISVIGPTELFFYIAYLITGSVSIFALLLIFDSQPFQALSSRLRSAIAKISELHLQGLLFGLTIGLVFMATALSHKGTPLTDDEWVYRFQADVLASGHLTAQPFGPANFYRNQYLVVTDKIYSQYPFGHSALLALGVLADWILLTPVIFAGLTTIIMYRIGGYLAGRHLGLTTAALLLFSPSFLLTQGTTASQSTVITVLAGYFYCLLRAVREQRIWYGLLAGMLSGLAIQIRPIDTLVVVCAGLILFMGLRDEWRRKRIYFVILALGIGSILIGGLYLLTNWQVNGDPFTTNYNPLWKDHPSGASSAFGFGNYPWGIEHTWDKGLFHSAVNFVRLNFWALGWPCSWLPIFLGLFARKDRWLRYALGFAIGVPFILYVFYFWPGMCDTGPAYYYFLLPFLAIAASIGLNAPNESLNPGKAWRLLTRPTNLVVASSMASLCFFLPIQLISLRKVTGLINEPYDYLEQQLDPNVKALVFTPFYFYLAVKTEAGISIDLSTPLIGLRNNKPDLSDRILIVRDLKERNQELINLFPDRTPYRFVRRAAGVYELTAIKPGTSKAPIVEPRRVQPKQPALLRLK